MTRDIKDRHEIFENFDIDVVRIALNKDQIDQYNPPPNPAKVTDSRAKEYIKEHGTSSWELDALEPRVMRTLIEDTVLRYRNEDIYQEVMYKEEAHKAILARVARDWETL